MYGSPAYWLPLCCIRWSQRASARFRVASGVSSVSRIRLFWWHRVFPVVELVDEDVACLVVDELPVDKDGPADFIVDIGHTFRQEHAADGDVRGVGIAVHLPVRHHRYQAV